METEAIYSLIKLMLEYIKQNDREEALFAALDMMVDEDVDLKEIQQYAEDEEEMWIVKCIKKYIKENYGDEEEEEW